MRFEHYTGLDVACALSQTNTSGVFIQWLLWLSAISVTPLIMHFYVYCAGEQSCFCMQNPPSPVSRPAYLELLHHLLPAVGSGAVLLIATKSFTPNNATLQQHNSICSCSLYLHYPSALAPSQGRTQEEQVRHFPGGIKLHSTKPSARSFLWHNSGIITIPAFHLCHAEK